MTFPLFAKTEVNGDNAHPLYRLLKHEGLELTDLYRRGREFESLHQLGELLMDWDERIWVWRTRHYTIVVRAIGDQTSGTQGTPVQVLGRLISQRQMPKLWEARGRLVELFEAERAAADDAARAAPGAEPPER